MSKIFTTRQRKECEICGDFMERLQPFKYECMSCGAKDDNG